MAKGLHQHPLVEEDLKHLVKGLVQVLVFDIWFPTIDILTKTLNKLIKSVNY